MSLKKTAVFAIVFLMLAVLYVIIEQPGSRSQRPEPTPVVTPFVVADAAAVRIRVPDAAPVVLARAGDSWQVHGDNQTFGADRDAVADLLDNARTLASATIVSRNPDRFEPYAVTAATGIEVCIRDAAAQPLAHFYVGKSGPDIFSTYVRAADADTVYLVNQILKNTYDRELKDWRDKTILNLSPEQITAYRVTGDRQLTLARTDNNTWAVTEPLLIAAPTDAAAQAIDQFCRLQAVDFAPDNATGYGLTAPVRQVAADTASGTITLLVGRDKNAFQRYVRLADQPQVYVLESYQLDGLCPDAEQLQPPPIGGDNATAGP